MAKIGIQHRIDIVLQQHWGSRVSWFENGDGKGMMWNHRRLVGNGAPFAAKTLEAMNAANTAKPSVKAVPYTGGQFVSIPEFQGIGTTVGQQFSAALAGSSTVDAALAAAQSATEREMKRAGYIK